MLVNAIFLLTVGAHALTCMFSIRVGILIFFFFYPLYPRFFALGVSSEGFALTGQRAMLFLLAGFYVLRVLWGSVEVRRGLEELQRYKVLFYAVVGFLLARLAGNLVTLRIDLGSIAALVGEVLLSLFAMVLVVTYFRSRNEVVRLLSVIVVSLLVSQLTATFEFFRGESLFPQELEIQYESAIDEERLLEGRTRADVYRAMAFFDNPLELAGLICLTFPLAIAAAGIRQALMLRLLSILSVLLAIPVAVFTGSRTAVGAVLLVIAWYAYLSISRGMTRFGRMFFALVAIAGGIGAVWVVGSGLIERVLFGEGFTGSTTYRALQYVYVAATLPESPLFGFGFARNIGDVVDIRPLDSFYLRMVLEGGIAALLAYFLAISRCLSIHRRLLRQSGDALIRGLATALMVSLTMALLIAFVLSLPFDRLYIFVAIGLTVTIANWHDANEGNVQSGLGHSPRQ